jgi:hypothetical protein
MSRADEWYHFKDVQPGLHPLVLFQPSSIGEDIPPYPISWSQEFEGGRVFYTGLGHTDEAYTEPYFLKHLLGGIEWALGKER